MIFSSGQQCGRTGWLLVWAILLSLTTLAQPPASTEVTTQGVQAKNHLEAHRRNVRMRPGDQIRVSLAEDQDVSYVGEISGAGLIPIPYLGDFHIAGLSAVEAEQALKKALLADLYERATPSVTIVKQATRHVYVYGAVEAPGRVSMPAGDDLTVVQAVTDRSGLAVWGAPEKAYVLRRNRGQKKRTRIPVNLVTAFGAIDGDANLVLAHDDIIFVPSAGSVSVLKRTSEQVYVYGAVKFPGRRKLPAVGQLTLMQAITESGGLTNWAETKNAAILRLDKDGGGRRKVPVNISAAFESIDGAANVELEPNDIVFVPSTAVGGSALTSESLEIIVSGEVNRPGLVRFEPGEQRSFIRAIFKAGNFTEFAKKSTVRLIRYDKDGARIAKEIDAGKIIAEGYLENDFELQPGDMIIVGERRLIF